MQLWNKSCIRASFHITGCVGASTASPSPMIRSKTAYGIGGNSNPQQVSSAPNSPMTGNNTKSPRMIARSPSSAKEMLLIWVQQRVNTYPVSS